MVRRGKGGGRREGGEASTGPLLCAARSSHVAPPGVYPPGPPAPCVLPSLAARRAAAGRATNTPKMIWEEREYICVLPLIRPRVAASGAISGRYACAR